MEIKKKKIQDLQTCKETYNDSAFDDQVFLLKYPNLNKSFLYQNPTKTSKQQKLAQKFQIKATHKPKHKDSTTH